MNKIVNSLCNKPITLTLRQVCDQYRRKKTAFIGTCGAGDKGLYFIGYKVIIFAKQPTDSWTVDNCPVTIDKFVDVEIKIMEQKDGE